jgi:septum formation protein
MLLVGQLGNGNEIVLASLSPRRRELLQQIGVQYRQIPVKVDEVPRPGEAAAEYVIRLALLKATVGRRTEGPDAPVLAADTAVVLGGKILGKPRDQTQALEMMQQLSGRTHEVLTGIALDYGQQECRLNVSRVSFRRITRQEAIAYWLSGEPADKAGGYAIQGRGALFISHLEGSYSGVMGLPLFETAELLRDAGVKLL